MLSLTRFRHASYNSYNKYKAPVSLFTTTHYRLHCVRHLGHSEAMEAGGREFDPRPGHYNYIVG